jgi:hypothetical protein
MMPAIAIKKNQSQALFVAMQYTTICGVANDNHKLGFKNRVAGQ